MEVDFLHAFPVGAEQLSRFARPRCGRAAAGSRKPPPGRRSDVRRHVHLIALTSDCQIGRRFPQEIRFATLAAVAIEMRGRTRSESLT